MLYIYIERYTSLGYEIPSFLKVKTISTLSAFSTANVSQKIRVLFVQTVASLLSGVDAESQLCSNVLILSDVQVMSFAWGLKKSITSEL